MKIFKSFAEIPTLPKWPLIGHGYLFLPGSKYSIERLTEVIEELTLKLGPIFRLNLGPQEMVITMNPDDLQAITQNEGKTPQRPTFDALTYYRQKTYRCAGLVPENGQNWLTCRRAITPIMDPTVIQAYKPAQEAIANDFISYLKSQRNEENVINNLLEHSTKYAMEAISVISPGKRIKSDDEIATKVIKASNEFMQGLYLTLIKPPFWKIYKTSGYKMIERSHKIIYDILEKDLKELFENENKDNPLLNHMLKNGELSWKMFVILSMEIFFGGIDAIATTLALTLHYLAHNLEVQELARKAALGNDVGFLRACVKETLRISQTAGAHSRFLVNDTVLSGYMIPKKTMVMLFTSATSRSEEYYNDPEVYNPLRWIQRTNKHRFASLPFGYGARACPGQRIAMQELVLAIQKVLLNFELGPIGEEKIGMIYRMNRIPERPIPVKFSNLRSEEIIFN